VTDQLIVLHIPSYNIFVMATWTLLYIYHSYY